MLINTVICSLSLLIGLNNRVVVKVVGTEYPRMESESGNFVNFCASLRVENSSLPMNGCARFVNSNLCQYVGPVYNGWEEGKDRPGGGWGTAKLSSADYSPGKPFLLPK